MYAITLMGEVTIRHAGRPLRPPPPRSLELLCYLLSHRTRPHSRLALLDTLWPDEGPESARRVLRQALWKLKAALTSTEGVEPPPLLVAPAAGWLGVDAAVVGQLDVDALTAAHARTAGRAPAALTDDDAAAVDAALQQCTGDFLAGWQHTWCVAERTRLQFVRLDLLTVLAGYCEFRHRYAQGIEYGRQALALDPAREITHRQLMRLLYGSGDRVGAIRQFQDCVDALAQEYGVPPSTATADLYRSILRDLTPVQLPTEIPLVLDASPPAGDPLAAVHERLNRIQQTLDVVVAMIGAPPMVADVLLGDDAPLDLASAGVRLRSHR
jgi:DNA-binding SARP family transcriptional activator